MSCRLIRIISVLDKARTDLKIARIRVGITSLEDVFKKSVFHISKYIIHNDDVQCFSEVLKTERENPKAQPDLDIEYYSFRPKKFHSGVPLALIRTWAMLVKRFKVLWRQPGFLLAQLLIPIFTTGLGIFVNNVNKRYNPIAKPLDLFDLSPYQKTTTLLQFDSNIAPSIADSFASIYAGASVATNPVPFSMNLTDEILGQARDNGAATFMLSHFFGTSINGSHIVQYFNNIAGHSIGTSVSIASNALLKFLTNNSYEIHTINQPLPPAFIVYFLFGEEFVLALCLSIGLLLSLSIFVVYLTQERASGAKHLQRLAGVSATSYWLGNMSVDWLICTVVNLLVMLTLWLGQVVSGQTQFLADSRSWPHILLLLELHSWALLPLSYICSTFFSSAASGIAKLIITNLVLSLAPCCVAATLQALSFEQGLSYLKSVESGLSRNASIFLPQFALSKALMSYYTNRLMEDQCNRMNQSCANLGRNSKIN